ncbi:MAG: deoxyribonuclease IV [Candidatus Berkelbacteria bacterium]|nr:MAG: deoxyribonuclease IV [Candidatus Berkelbacteria bacterium]QQG52026.1 MAG: deoxyribonuclease IV [Candidatus Berkelbacteria bacterium]
MIIGAHVPTAGGLETALKKGREIGAEALQIFPSAPLQWKIRGWSDEACAAFLEAWPKQFKQVIFHGIYLTNLAGASADNVVKTITALTETLKLAPKVGVVGTVFHPGTYNGGIESNAKQIKQIIKTVLDATPPEAKLIYENSAGSTIGGKLEDLAWLLENSSDRKRAGVCLDTCHAFAAGYDISNAEGYEKYVNEVSRLIGLENVFCWHLNDSKFDLGAKRDRHENIGEGKMGSLPFELIVNDERWANLAGYLEVPGYDNLGPDARNVATLTKLRP